MVTEWTVEQTNVGIFYADTFCAYLFFPHFHPTILCYAGFRSELRRAA